VPNELYPVKPTIDPKVKAAIMEEDEPLMPEDIAKICQRSMEAANPMVTMKDGSKRVACTLCHKRPLQIARLCQECYDQKIAEAEWRSRVGIVRRGKGKPKATCPWCNHTERGWSERWSDVCCGDMKMAVLQIMREEGDYARAADKFQGEDWL
jgi:hypothetical protein